MIDWSELERRPNSGNTHEENQIRIPVKQVAVRKDQVKRLPDGTTIVISDDKTDITAE